MLLINVDSRQAWIDETLIQLTWTEFEILTTLASAPIRCFSKSEITRSLWGRDYFHDAHTIESHMSRLRKKLDSSDRSAPWITTVRKAGYRLESRHGEDVHVIAASNPRLEGISALTHQ